MRASAQQSEEGLSCIVVEFSSINDVDASALRMLQDLHKELKERKMRLLLAMCKGPVREVFDRSGFMEEIKPTSLCVSLAEAVRYAARVHAIHTGKSKRRASGAHHKGHVEGGQGTSGGGDGNGDGDGNGVGNGHAKPVPESKSFDSELGSAGGGSSNGGWTGDAGSGSFDSEEGAMTRLAAIAAADADAAEAAAALAMTPAHEARKMGQSGSSPDDFDSDEGDDLEGGGGGSRQGRGGAAPTVDAPFTPRCDAHDDPTAATPAWLRQAAAILPGGASDDPANEPVAPQVPQKALGLPKAVQERRARKFERMQDDDEDGDADEVMNRHKA